MRARASTRLVIAAIGAVAVLAPTAYAQQQRRAVPKPDVTQSAPGRDVYDRGYRQGIDRGERDGRDGRDFNYERDGAYRSADNGYDRRYGSRDDYRNEFRRGFAEGYRSGYDRYRSNGRDRDERWDRSGRNDRDGWGRDRRVPRGYQEPAAARGYSDGYDKGLDDGRDRDRYDPARHGDYRDADEGYSRQYGSKDAYRNNYRAGFRQGYEDGYRSGTRRY